MKNNVSEDEVSESSFLTQFAELVFVLWIGLKPKTNAQNERGHRRYEARQERVERECAHKTTVDELYDSGQKNVEEIGVDQLQPSRRPTAILAVEPVQHFQCVGHLKNEKVFIFKDMNS